MPEVNSSAFRDADGTCRARRYWIRASSAGPTAHRAISPTGRSPKAGRLAALPRSTDVEFRTFHRNDAPRTSSPPVHRRRSVVARTDRGLVALLGPEDLDACSGDVERFRQALSRACADRNLRRDLSGSHLHLGHHGEMVVGPDVFDRRRAGREHSRTCPAAGRRGVDTIT